MGRMARIRITAVVTAFVLFASGAIYYYTNHVAAFKPGSDLGESSLGVSGWDDNDRNENGLGSSGGSFFDKDKDKGFEDDADLTPEFQFSAEEEGLALGASGLLDALPVHVSTYTQLRDIVQAASGEVSIILDDNITINRINVPANAQIYIDGQGTYGLTNTNTSSHTFYLNANSFLKLSNMNLNIITIHGIAQSNDANCTLHVENCTVRGTQLFYGPHNYTKVIITNCEIDIEKMGSTNPQELLEGAYLIFDGGNTNIRHRLNDTRTEIWSVFWMKGESTGAHMTVTNGAQVTITARNYIWYPVEVGGRGNVYIDSGCSLEMTAPAMLYSTGSNYQMNSITVNENATFHFTQRGTSTCATTPRLIIKGDVTVKEGAVFDYHNMRTENTAGFEIGGTFRIQKPKRVSIYCANTAFRTVPTMDVSGVNAINFWTDAASANPDYDSAAYLPQYMWNEVITMGYTNNKAFNYSKNISFSGKGNNLTVTSGEMYDLVQGASLSSTLKFDQTAKRINMGHIDGQLEAPPKISTMKDTIEGISNSNDVAAHYVDLSGTKTIATNNGPFPIYYNSTNKPKPNTDVLVVGNWGGMRGGVVSTAMGSLELVSVPSEVYFGVNELPLTKTRYNWTYCDNVTSDGKMLIEVVDGRASDTSDWKLCVQMAQLGGKQPLPDNSLIFVDGSREYTISYAASTPVYNGDMKFEYTEHTLSWGENEGLLAEFGPGNAQIGEYGSVLHWSLEIVPRGD